MRDPHVQWCERLSPSATAGGAGYSITGSGFFSILPLPVYVVLSWCNGLVALLHFYQVLCDRKNANVLPSV